jgi:hypothetical protein
MFDQFHRVHKLAMGLFYQPPAFAIGFDTLSVKEFPTGNMLVVPVGRLYVRDIRVIATLDVPFPPQKEGFIIPAEVEDGLPIVQVVAGGEVVALAGQGFLIFDPIISSKYERELLLTLSKALAIVKNTSTACMLC